MNKATFRIIVILVLFKIFCTKTYSQSLTYNGDFSDSLEYWYYSDNTAYSSYQFISNGTSNTFHVNIFEQPPIYYGVQLTQSCKSEIEINDILTLDFKLKNPSGIVVVAIQDNGSPYKKHSWIELPISDSIVNYRIVYNGGLYNWNAGDVSLCFFLGYHTGNIDLSDISFQNLGSNINIDTLNATFVYDKFFGTQLVNEDWRSDALQRIDSLRKSPLTIICKNTQGILLNGVQININQIKKHFAFGTAVDAKLFGGDTYNQEYIDKTKQLFNMVVVQNHLKWAFYEDAHPSVDYVFDWADSNDITVKGTCLFWPSYIHCPPWVQGLSPVETYDSIISHVEQYCHEYSDKVVQWDVINEAVTNTEISDYTGLQVLADAFIKAKLTDPNAKLLYNDYNLLKNDPVNQVAVKNLLNQLIQMGAPIDGIGIQGHLYLISLPTPANVLNNLNIMSELGLPIYLTELDISVGNFRNFQADYFKDILTAIYSHPNVHGIIQWGFWEGSHWQPEAALYDTNWSPRPNGVVFEQLMSETWNTDSTLYSNATGNVQLNCFNGKLSVEGLYNGVSIVDTIYLNPFSQDTLILTFNETAITTLNHEVNKINLFPNPCNSQITITTSHSFKNATISFMNIQGKIIKTESNYCGKFYNLDISKQPNGLYFIEIVNGDHPIRLKLIKNGSILE